MPIPCHILFYSFLQTLCYFQEKKSNNLISHIVKHTLSCSILLFSCYTVQFYSALPQSPFEIPDRYLYLLSVSLQNHRPTLLTAQFSHVTVRRFCTRAFFLQEKHSTLRFPVRNDKHVLSKLSNCAGMSRNTNAPLVTYTWICKTVRISYTYTFVDTHVHIHMNITPTNETKLNLPKTINLLEILPDIYTKTKAGPLLFSEPPTPFKNTQYTGRKTYGFALRISLHDEAGISLLPISSFLPPVPPPTATYVPLLLQTSSTSS